MISVRRSFITLLVLSATYVVADPNPDAPPTTLRIKGQTKPLALKPLVPQPGAPRPPVVTPQPAAPPPGRVAPLPIVDGKPSPLAAVFVAKQHVFYYSADHVLQNVTWDGRWRMERGPHGLPGSGPIAVTWRKNRVIAADMIIELASLRGNAWNFWNTNSGKWNTISATAFPQNDAATFQAYTPKGLAMFRYRTRDWVLYEFNGSIYRVQFPHPADADQSMKWSQYESNISAAAGNAPAAQAGTPSGYQLGTSEHIMYRGRNDHIYELYSSDQSDIADSYADLTAAARAPMSASDPVVYVYGSSQQVFFVAADRHVHNLTRESAWRDTDISADAGFTGKAMSAVVAYPLGDSQHVVFRGDDNKIHELYWTPGQKWKHTDVTTAGGGKPTTGGDPVAYLRANTQHIVYVGSDQHLHELWYDGSWKDVDISVAAVAP